jgi:hypothetical protein
MVIENKLSGKSVMEEQIKQIKEKQTRHKYLLEQK